MEGAHHRRGGRTEPAVPDPGHGHRFWGSQKDLREETEALDHRLIIERGSLREKTFEALTEENFLIEQVDFRPTAENFAKYFYDRMTEKGYRILESTVYETPNNRASYTPK